MSNQMINRDNLHGCEIEGKSYTYNNLALDRIKKASSSESENEFFVIQNLATKIEEDSDPRLFSRTPSFSDLVFLPANLTRLVIDPYREKCAMETTIGSLSLKTPVIIDCRKFLETEDLDDTLIITAMKSGCSLLKRASRLYDNIDFFSLFNSDESDVPAIAMRISNYQTSESAALIKKIKESFVDVPVGVILTDHEVKTDIVSVANHGANFIILDASNNSDTDEQDHIEILNNAVLALREANLEGNVDLIYRGGIRDGADLARAIALGAKAVVIDFAARIAMGNGTAAEMSERLCLFTNAILQESTVLARCCGKTSLMNLEPEDMRSFTEETTRATGIPLVGLDRIITRTSFKGE